MKTMLLFVTLLILLILPACRDTDQLPESIATEQEAPAESKLETAPTAEGQITDNQDATRVADPVPPSAPALSDQNGLPAPTLFDTGWDDRQLFQAGLIESQQGVMDALSSASVYHMNLIIEEPTVVTGQMEVLYTNQENIPLNEIYFHLLPNQLGGSITISDVLVNGSAVETDTRETFLRVPLDTALKQDQSIVVKMGFTTTVPVEESTKYNILAFNEDILALAHFYPMVATYDDQGWHIEPSPPHGDETYGDMSHFLVQVAAPAEQVVVTSGVEVDRSESGDMQNITIAAAPMRDFYLAMSDRYDVRSDNVGPVQINSYAPSELLDGAEMALDVTAHALRSFNERYGPYPYTELDIVATPTLALGVEYPGIFANAVRIYDLSGSTTSGIPNRIFLESTTAHETAHQWFYNLVGSDQLNEPWLDEATTQYATWMYYRDRYGEQNAAGYYDSFSSRWERNEFADIPIGLPAEAYNVEDYGPIIYGRGPIFLDELAQQMGQAIFDAFLYDYSRSYRWQIASSEDLQALAEQHCQCDLSSLFNAAVYGR